MSHPFRKWIAAAICLAVLAAVAALRTAATAPDAPVEPAAGPAFVMEPYLQFATRTSISILCETPTPTACVLEYGSTFPPDRSIAVEKPDAFHEIKIENLQPRTKYFYRVTCTDADGVKIAGKPSTFQTAVDVTDAYSFAVLGDTQRNPVVTGKVAKLMWERRPNFVIHLGDVVDNGASKAQWTDDLFKPCRELFARVPVYPCIGNHEKDHAQYYKYFALPKPEYHYSFKYGNGEFFSLDTNRPVDSESAQYRWLDKALAASDAKWKIVYHHHPCYSSDSDDYGNTEKASSTYGAPKHKALIALYDKHKVDLVMNGHIHAYERTWPLRGGKVDAKAGTTYLTSGGGGGRLEGFEPTPAFFKNQSRVDYHFCHVTVHGGTLDCRVFDSENRLFDQFSIGK